MKCERGGCTKTPLSYDLFDYCAECGKNLCPDHMTLGCCGKIPAESGMGADDATDQPTAGPSKAVSAVPVEAGRTGNEPDYEGEDHGND